MKENTPEEKKRKVTKVGAIALAGLTALAGASYGVKKAIDYSQNDQIELNEHEVMGEAEISVGSEAGDEYAIYFTIDGIVDEKLVTKETYDYCVNRKKVKVKYNDQTKQILAIYKGN